MEALAFCDLARLWSTLVGSVVVLERVVRLLVLVLLSVSHCSVPERRLAVSERRRLER